MLQLPDRFSLTPAPHERVAPIGIGLLFGTEPVRPGCLPPSRRMPRCYAGQIKSLTCTLLRDTLTRVRVCMRFFADPFSHVTYRVHEYEPLKDGRSLTLLPSLFA